MDEFDSLEKGYATLKSSNESETRVWCFLFFVWLTILIILLIPIFAPINNSHNVLINNFVFWLMLNLAFIDKKNEMSGKKRW